MSKTIEDGYASSPGFLYATLRAYNATGASNDTSPNTSNGQNGDDEDKGGSNTALAMYAFLRSAVTHVYHSCRIVLYAITGCVSALFCVIIITGVRFVYSHQENVNRL